MADNQNNQNTVNEDEEEGEPVPGFIVEDLRELNDQTPLRRVAEKFQFPLSQDDMKDLTKLALRFESMEDAAGLSLPQLGINKRAFIFEIKKPKPEELEGEAAGTETPRGEPTADELESVNPADLGNINIQDIVENKDPNVIWPKTIWINPSYTIPRDALLDEDFEICYSLKCDSDFVTGPVFRLNRINYRAYDTRGRPYEGQAEGYVARVIQHEIDHLDGKLYIDYVQPDRVMKLPQYGEKLESGEGLELQKGVAPQFTK